MDEDMRKLAESYFATHKRFRPFTSPYSTSPIGPEPSQDQIAGMYGKSQVAQMKRQADEPLVTKDVAEYLQAWFEQ